MISHVISLLTLLVFSQHGHRAFGLYNVSVVATVETVKCSLILQVVFYSDAAQLFNFL